jgi:hypothetical protein
MSSALAECAIRIVSSSNAQPRRETSIGVSGPAITAGTIPVPATQIQVAALLTCGDIVRLCRRTPQLDGKYSH